MAAGRALAAALLLGLLTPSAAFAQGGGQVQIGSLDDIRLGTWEGGGNLQGDDRHCVMGGKPNGVFRLTAQGSGPGGSFQLSQGARDLPYQVWYDDGSGLTELSANSPESGLQGLKKNKDFDDCRDLGTGQETLRIRVLESDLVQAFAGGYSGVLTLTVEPQ